MKKNNHQIYTVLFGGSAGDGIREAGLNFGRLLVAHGYSVMVTADYPSLIRGGHNFTRVTFSHEQVTSDYKLIDVLVAFNEETYRMHKSEIIDQGLAFFDANITTINPAKDVVALPITETMKTLGATPIMRSSVVLGALCNYFSINLSELNTIFRDIFKDKASDLNIALAKVGFDSTSIIKHRPHLLEAGKFTGRALYSGNQAVAEGAVKAGMNIYMAYPMTPASSIQEYLAKNKTKFKIKVVQPENEIAAVNMALGSAYAGARTVVGTADGGFALMQEAFSLAGMSEIPTSIIVSQRPGPSTGVPTYTTQGSLHFVRHAGHGEFIRVVYAPGDIDESCTLSAWCLNLAWKYQIPTITLLDKHLSESFQSTILPLKDIKIIKSKEWNGRGQYLRYAFARDGVSPMALPGTKNANVKVTSYEHDQQGLSVESADEIIAMANKRHAKLSHLVKEKMPNIKVYGQSRSKRAVIFWGSTKGAVLEASKYLKKEARLIQVLLIEPFPTKDFLKSLKGVEKIIIVEANMTSQLAELIREKTGLEIKNKILRYDGRPFDPLELSTQINKKF